MTLVLEALRELLADHKVRSSVTRRFSATIEPNVRFKGDLRNLSLGPEVVIQSGTVIHLGGMAWCEDAGAVEIGAGSVVSHGCTIFGCGPGGVRIGKNFDCGPGVCIFASRTDYVEGPEHHVFAPVEIGDEVVVFANVVIGPGVQIGDRATIAAGSVVTRDVPAGCLAGGSPARVLREGVR